MAEECYVLSIDDAIGDYMSLKEQLAYEENIIKECREWIDDDRNDLISVEHVSVLLSWLDAVTPDKPTHTDTPVF